MTQEQNPLEKLYNVLHEDELYTKSFDEFKTKYSTDEEIDKLFSVVSENEYYTKDIDTFKSQYFPKSKEVSTQGSEGTSQTFGEPSAVNTNIDTLEAGNVLQNQATEEDYKLAEQGLRRVLVDVPVVGLGGDLSRQGEFIIPESAVGSNPQLIEINQEGKKGYAVVYTDESGVEQIVNERLPEPSNDKGFVSDMYNSLLSGVEQFNENLFSTPEFLYRLASLPQNLLAEATGEDWLTARYGDVSQGTFNPLRVVGDLAKDASANSEEYASQVTKFEKGIGESILSGNFTDVGRQTFNSITQSLPSMVGMVITSGASQASNLGAISRTFVNALPFSSGAYQEMKEIDNVPESVKLMYSLGKGFNEVIFEQSFGTLPIMQSILDKSINKDGLQKILVGYFNEAITKQGIPTALYKGAISEMATELSNELVDVYGTQTKDNIDWMSIVDAGIVGAVMDGGLTSINKVMPNRADRTKVKELEGQIKSLKNDFNNVTNDSQASVLENTLNTKVNELNKIIETFQETTNLTQEQVRTLNEISNRESEINQLVEGEAISEESKTALEGELSKLDEERKAVFEESVKKEEVSTEETPDTTTEDSIKVNSSFAEVVFNEDKRTARKDELLSRIKQNWNDSNNLGVISDPKKEAELWRDITEYAVLQIADGTIKTVKALADLVGVDVKDVNLNKAFEDAKKINEDLKQFQVPKTTQSVKTTISKSTKKGIQGKVTLTNRQALINQIKTFNKGVKEGIKVSKEYGQTVNSYVKSLSADKGLKGVKLPSSVLNTITSKMASISNDAQLNKVLDVVDKIVTDGKFRLKIENVKSLQSKVKTALTTKNTPKDLASTVKEFTRINPLDLGDVDVIESYHDLLAKISSFKQGATKVNPAEMQRFVDLAEANREVKDLVKGQKITTDEAKLDKIEKLNQKLESVGIGQDIIDAITKGKNLDQTVQELEALYNEEKFTNEQKLRDVAKEYERAIVDNKEEIRNSLPTESDRKLFDKYLELGKNVDFVKKKDLTAYIATLYNTLNNGSIVKLGEYYNKQRVYENVNDKVVVESIVSNLRTPASWLSFISGNKSGSVKIASGSITKQQIQADIKKVGELDVFTGSVDVQIQSVKAQKAIEKVKARSEEIFKKYKEDLDDSVDNIKASIYGDVIQYRKSWDADKIALEYDARLQAWGESLNRLKENNNSDFQKDNKTYIENFEKALNSIATVKEVDGKQVWEHKFNQQELFDQLPEGQQEYYKFVRETYEDLKEDYFANMKFYLGLDVEADWQNYLPRSYQALETTNERASQRLLASTSGKINDAIASSFSGSVNKESSGAGQTRLISGEKLPNKVSLNPDIVGTFLNESSAMIYDTLTLGDRQFTGGMLDTDANGLSKQFTDRVPMTLYSEVVANKVLGDKLKVRYSNLPESGVKYMWRKLGTLGTVLSLGGIAQYVKQMTPLAEVMARTNPLTNTEALNLFFTNSEAVKRILSQGDIAIRDIGDYTQPSKTKNKTSTKDLEGIKKMLIKLGMSADQVTEWLSDKSLNPLKSMDSAVARIGWFMFYVEQTKRNNNGVIDLGTVDKNALAYANVQNSSVMNESDSSMQGQFTKLDWVRNMFPFMGFSINAKLSLLTSIDKFRTAKGAEKAKHVNEIIGGVSNILLFNGIGTILRYGATIGGVWFVKSIIQSSGLDDEEKEKLFEILDKNKERAIQLTLAKGVAYTVQDLLYGGLFGNYAEPVFEPITNYILETLYGEKYLEEIGFGETKFKKEDAIQNVLGVLGTQGIFLKKALETYKDAGDYFESKEDYVRRAEQKINAEGTGTVVDPSKLSPDGLDKFALPEWYKTQQRTTLLISALSLMGASDQTTNSFARQSNNMARKLIQAERGNVSKQTVDDMVKSFRKFEDVYVKGVAVPVDSESKAKYLADRLQYVVDLKASVKYGVNSSRRKRRTAEEYEKYISDLAESKAKKKFSREHKEEIEKLKLLAKKKKADTREERKSSIKFEQKERE